MHALVQEMVHFRNGCRQPHGPDPEIVSGFEKRYREILETARKEYENILNSLPNGEDTTVTLSGGEPLLHPLIWEFVKKLDEKEFGRKLMITNATLITPENC